MPPFYDYHCKRCDKVEDAYRHISDRHAGPECCHQQMMMVIVAPQVAPDLPGYESPVTGKWIDGRSARREDLRMTGCRPYEDGEREEHQRQVSYAEKKHDAERHETLARVFYAMSESKRRALSRAR